MSNSKITVVYQEGPPTELGLHMTFTSNSPAPQFEFFPARDNPHQLLSGLYAKLFASSRASFSSLMRDFLTSLSLTAPLLAYLHKLQLTYGVNGKFAQSAAAEGGLDYLRVHVLPRHASQFALQYFTPAGKAPKDIKDDSQPHLLARFEICHEISASKKPMWIVRSALEEFHSYSRPSYSTPELRKKLKDDIFLHRSDGSAKWITLDSAAGCLADAPEPLLSAIHMVLLKWAKQAKASEGKVVDKPVSNKINAPQRNNTPNTISLPNGPTNRATAPGKANAGKAQAPPTSANNKMQRPPSNGPGSRPMPASAKGNAHNPNNSEVITLD